MTRAPSLTVIVGDVHGCTRELEALLELVHFTYGRDRLLLVGDLIARGPDSHGSLAIVKRLGARSVRGNHEDKLLAWRHGNGSVGEEHERLARALSGDEWQMLEDMPLWIDLPEHDLRVVHAGVLPGAAIERTPQEALLKMRTIDEHGGWSEEQEGGLLWGECYAGPPHVLFGHNARPESQLHKWATGIDTGCVYGGRLTAVVLTSGERMPQGEAAFEAMRSVPAARKYYPAGANMRRA